MSYSLSRVSGRVLIIGGYGAGNLGDEAILRGLLQSTNTDVEEITVVSHAPTETRRLHKSAVPSGVAFETLEPTPLGLLQALFSHDVFVIGGGGLFSAYQGPYASKIPYYAFLAGLFRKSVHWTAIGVYPSTPGWTVQALKFAIASSESITVRDPISKEFLEESGITNVKLVPDPALELSPCPDQGRELLDAKGVDSEGRVLGIAPRRVRQSAANDQLQEVYIAVAEAFSRNGWEVVYLPFCSHPYEYIEMDEAVCENIQTESGVGTIISVNDPYEMLSIISALDGVVATRLHSMIFAYRCSVPFASIEYADKVSSLLDHYGESDRGIPLNEVSAERISRILSADLALDCNLFGS